MSTLQSPKGMRDIQDDNYYSLQGIFEKAQEIAVYYGFKPIETPILEHEDLFRKGVGEHTDIVEKEMYTLKTKGGDHLVMRPEGTAGVMRAYLEHGMQSLPQPVMLYYSGSMFRHESPQRGRYREFKQFGLELFGSEKPIADAIIIRTIADILGDVGLGNLVVQINSIGNPDSRAAYLRALTNYYKKHTDELCEDCVRRLKEQPLRLLDCKKEGCVLLRKHAPQTIGHLNQADAKHFKEVLEDLDGAGVVYKVNTSLVRGLDYYTRTVFEVEAPIPELLPDGTVDTTKPPKMLTIAAGGRYDGLAKVLGSRKPVSAVGAAIGLDRLLLVPEMKCVLPRILKKPKVYFIQLGFEARMKSLAVIEVLRKAKIPMAQGLAKDGLGPQLAIAEKTGIPYALIFGQKEAVDGTVIVRNMESRSQDTVKIEDLAEYVKKIK